MKEFDFDFKPEGLFKGLYPLEHVNKLMPGFEECHNLEPTEYDYNVHEFVKDLHSGEDIWYEGGDETPGVDYDDIWEDHDGDVWEDHDDDIWQNL